MTNIQKLSLMVAACGAATSVASAQPFGVNGSGATLLEALFKAPANTLDFIDADGDGIVQEQLAPFDATAPFISNQHWQFTYRVTGSGNGFAEMRDWSTLYATDPDLDPLNLTFNSDEADAAYFNTQLFIAAGVTQGASNSGNPGATPYRTLDDGSHAITTLTGAGTGVQMDFSALDVPVSWFVINDSGTTQYNRVPGAPGYGNNPRIATGGDGYDLSQGNKLKTLVSPNGATFNTNVSAPDAFTIYDTPVTLTPVAAITNLGVGMQEIQMSDLRHLNATGRRVNGENLMVVTRDSGSGTRNAYMNGICLDPSWGVGENIGPKTSSSVNDKAGPDFTPSNKGGSSRMEATVKNTRLGIGHTGAERGQSKGWLIDGELELFAVQADLKGGTVFARPTIENVVDGGPDGYNIQGLGGIATVGDPRSAPANLGGWGWDASEIGANPNPVQPMRNLQAAAYVNNITRSVAAVSAVPSDPANAFSPGEFLGIQFVLPATSYNVPETNPDASEICIPIVPNAERNDVLTQFVLNDPNNVLALSEYASYNTNTGGIVPTRTLGVTYDDGISGGTHFESIDGTRIDYGSFIGDLDFDGEMENSRNLIAGDFNGDGARNSDDVADMIAAYNFAFNGGSWNGGSVNPDRRACLEILGDFDADGNFNDVDVRYFADGLHLVGGNLDRKAGFVAVDAAAGANFFGTSLVTGVYDDGDSRGDVASADFFGFGSMNPLPTRGFRPNGYDGVVDGADVDYVCANFGDWSVIDQAVHIDLSADMNGDLVVDASDVVEIVEGILDSSMGDFDLDGDVDADDRAIIVAFTGEGMFYSEGDIDCDGDVDGDDLAAWDALNGSDCPADLNEDGLLDFFDISFFLSNSVDFNEDTVFDFFDISAFLGAYGAGCP
ncbi:MAG: hypothetical protein ACSHX5_09990 [Phycisphaerales bacterium]